MTAEGTAGAPTCFLNNYFFISFWGGGLCWVGFGCGVLEGEGGGVLVPSLCLSG
jgi:hypothetical protein